MYFDQSPIYFYFFIILYLSCKLNRLYGICFDGAELLVVMEYCDKGDLSQMFESEQFSNWSTRLKIIKQIAHAINNLHKNGMIHRDIKSRNILVKTIGENGDDFEIKIGDLGLAKLKANSNTFLVSANPVGTFAWIAPGNTTYIIFFFFDI